MAESLPFSRGSPAGKQDLVLGSIEEEFQVMTSGWRKAITALLLASAGAALLPVPASAQESADARLRRIESEIRALQRTVFPGGDGRYFTPEVDTARPLQPQTTNAPSTSTMRRA